MIESRITILDYGVGNLYSIKRAVSGFTSNFVVTDDPGEISKADKLILPGVGSFEAGMAGLRLRGLEKPIKKFAASGKPILGICLGAQMLMTRGYEFGRFDGLNIIPGDVIKFPRLPVGIKIPHIGWSQVSFVKSEILNSVPNNAHVYFVHSYILKPKDPNHILTKTIYGGYEFCSAIHKGNVYGFQFHPEKSGDIGLKIVKNFIKLKNND